MGCCRPHSLFHVGVNLKGENSQAVLSLFFFIIIPFELCDL